MTPSHARHRVVLFGMSLAVLAYIDRTVIAQAAPLISAEASDQELPIELWVGKDDSLLRRFRVLGPVSPGESNSAKRTIELSDYCEPVDIAPPD